MKIWQNFKEVQSELHYIWVFENIIVCSEKPLEIYFSNNRLHNEMGPSVLYKDGYCLYNLNGVPVPGWVVKTNQEDMDSKKILQISNVEQRREAIRKMGYTLFFEQLKAKQIDKKSIWINDYHKVNGEKTGREIGYELLECDIGLSKKAKVLKMKNPSVEGIYHYECVPFECKTIDDAFYFRNGERMLAEYLS